MINLISGYSPQWCGSRPDLEVKDLVISLFPGEGKTWRETMKWKELFFVFFWIDLNWEKTQETLWDYWHFATERWDSAEEASVCWRWTSREFLRWSDNASGSSDSAWADQNRAKMDFILCKQSCLHSAALKCLVFGTYNAVVCRDLPRMGLQMWKHFLDMLSSLFLWEEVMCVMLWTSVLQQWALAKRHPAWAEDDM